jgi:hypothetical protein
MSVFMATVKRAAARRSMHDSAMQIGGGRDAALRRPRPHAAGGIAFFLLLPFGPLYAARSSQRDDPTSNQIEPHQSLRVKFVLRMECVT